MVTVIALSVALGSVLLDIYITSVMRRMDRQHAREREALINKIMHMADKTWQPPPVHAQYNQEPEPVESAYVTDPSMLPEETEE